MNEMEKKKIKDVIIRSVKTFCQTACAMITVGSPMAAIDWGNVASVSLVAAIVSILTNIGGVEK